LKKRKSVILFILTFLLVVVASANATQIEDYINEKNETITQDVPQEKKEPPGFEAIFAIAGLFAVILLIRRRN